jgi:hypothetical protein
VASALLPRPPQDDDDPASATANGTQLDIWDCDGGANQQWNLP